MTTLYGALIFVSLVYLAGAVSGLMYARRMTRQARERGRRRYITRRVRGGYITRRGE